MKSVSVTDYLEQLNTTGSFPDENVNSAKVGVQGLEAVTVYSYCIAHVSSPLWRHVSFRVLCPAVAMIPYKIQAELKAMLTAFSRQIRLTTIYFKIIRKHTWCHIILRFQVFIEADVKMTAFWHIAPYRAALIMEAVKHLWNVGQPVRNYTA